MLIIGHITGVIICFIAYLFIIDDILNDINHIPVNLVTFLAQLKSRMASLEGGGVKTFSCYFFTDCSKETLPWFIVKKSVYSGAWLMLVWWFSCWEGASHLSC